MNQFRERDVVVVKQRMVLREAVWALRGQLRRLRWGLAAGPAAPEDHPAGHPPQPVSRPSTHQRVAIRAHREDWP
jgi:hypothetical protein